MSRFSPQTERALRAAGWFPGRDVDVSSLEKVATGGGGRWRAGDAARAFYREFGGLTLRPGGTSDPYAAVRLSPDKWVRDDFDDGDDFPNAGDLSAVGPCTPVGATWDGDCYLLMDAAGRVHEWWHSSVPSAGAGGCRLLAASGDAALDALCAAVGPFGGTPRDRL